MAERGVQNLSGVAETLLIPLYVRAMESQRQDALLKDEKAVALVTQMEHDFSRIKQLKLDEQDKTALVLRNREFDRHARDFLAMHPEAVVVHIGSGLASRFERVDNGLVEWYDLDSPEVIELPRKLVGGERSRHHFLACSVFDNTWPDTVHAHHPRPFLFWAEGVLMYFEAAQVKSIKLGINLTHPAT